ncbi:hypothetical protein RK767_06710, partial [Streptococcus pneumoniae]|nr:hypothetical protein [Streptococcus pneumoniae]MDS3311098.1 hypothetical protein [Streptococcus pneumoniae]MDS4470317.1 hypothetical protein [Streptococcus pneumoniae]MDS8813364.1 hypothetical protein [Streptococcus pneumoniae]
LSSKKHPLGEKRNHPGSKLRQGFWMVFRFGVNNWGYLLSSKNSPIELESGCLYSMKIKEQTRKLARRLLKTPF